VFRSTGRPRISDSSLCSEKNLSPGTWLEFDEHVTVAIRPEIFAKNRSEERELANVVAAAEVGNSFSIDCDPASVHRSTLFA
jgi:hypothetical protein